MWRVLVLLTVVAVLPRSAMATESSPVLLGAYRPDPAMISGMPAPGRPGRRPETHLLGVTINGQEKPDMAEVLRFPDGTLALPHALLQNWHFKLPGAPDLQAEGVPYTRLNTLNGIKTRIESTTQMLIVEAPAQAFVPHSFTYFGEPSPPQPATTSPGAYLNYDLQVDRLRGDSTEAGLFEVGAFNQWGNGTASALYRSNSPFERAVRLDTSWTVDLPEHKQSVRLGDAIGYSGTWGRAVRFGGLQWRTNFSLSPGFVPYPMPTLRGETSLPSTFDVYVNNNHRYRGEVPPGPFDLANIPVVTGQGEIKIAVRDALGREQVLVNPYYVSPSLLKPGLHEFSVEAGQVREDYGFFSNEYGRSFFSVTHRHGLSPTFTPEWRAEVLRSQQTLGVSGAWLAAGSGTARLFGAASHASSEDGWSLGANFDQQTRAFSYGIRATFTSEGFSQIGQTEDDKVRSTASVNFGTSWLGGSVGAAFAQRYTWQDERNRVMSINYSRNLGSRYGYLSIGAWRQSGESASTVFTIMLIHSIDSRTSVTGSSIFNQGDSLFRATMQRSTPNGPGFGYLLNAERGDSSRTSAEARWNTPAVAVTTGVATMEGKQAYRAGLSGGSAFMANSWHFGRRIDDSFAVVKVGDYPDVTVLRDNQPVARTNAQGIAFVSGMRGYERNRISIDASGLPFDAHIDQLELEVTPRRRSGVTVDFPVRRDQTANVQLLSSDGKPLPPGSQVRLAGEEKSFLVGYDGKVFLSGLTRWNNIVLEGDRQQCPVTTDTIDRDSVVDLGTITCHRLLP